VDENSADGSVLDDAIVTAAVEDECARSLFYHARINLDLLADARARLERAFDRLEFDRFLISTGGYEALDGPWLGEERRLGHLNAEKQRVIGALYGVLTAGLRFVRALRGARSRDRGRDWANVRDEMNSLEESYRPARNFLEHFVDELAQGKPKALTCEFSSARVLSYPDRTMRKEFDFSSNALCRPYALHSQVMTFLAARGTNGRRP
jgi:hypothetical protein